ncbi:MAG: porin [Rhodoferax sp.]
MKKTLIAIAALAAAGASFAETTVYGKLDAGLFNSTAGGTAVSLNGYETSRFGVKAEEKAGGLTFSAQLEGKISDTTSDGQATFAGFNRTATLGVAGSFGTLTVGNQWTPFDNAVWTSDATEYSGFTSLKATTAWTYDVGNTGMGNAKSSVQYATPVVSGFQAIVLSAPNVTGNTQGATNYSGIGLNYGNGPLVINLATQAMSNNGGPTANSMVLAVNYDFGVAKAYGGVINTDSGTAGAGKDASYTVGVAVPFGADSLRVSYAGNKTTISGQSDSTSSAWAAMYLKPLSKAALGYAGVGSFTPAGASAVNTTGVGIRYNF